MFSAWFQWCFSLFISDVFNLFSVVCSLFFFSVMSSARFLVMCFLMDVFSLFFSARFSLLPVMCLLFLSGVISLVFSIVCQPFFFLSFSVQPTSHWCFQPVFSDLISLFFSDVLSLLSDWLSLLFSDVLSLFYICIYMCVMLGPFFSDVLSLLFLALVCSASFQWCVQPVISSSVFSLLFSDVLSLVFSDVLSLLFFFIDVVSLCSVMCSACF